MTFWGTLCQLANKDDLDGFKNLISTDFRSIDEDKFVKATLLVHEKPKFMEYLIFECGVKRKDVEQDIINPITEKFFIAQELMEEAATNPRVKNKTKI